MFLMSLGLVETSEDTVAAYVANHSSSVTSTMLPYTTNEPQRVPETYDETRPNLFFDFLSNQIGSIIAGQCHTTYALQPLYYHLGCAFFLLGFLAPSQRYGSALYMRCMLIFGSILFAMWSYLNECRPDVLVWSGVFIVANLIHMFILICRLRPVKFEREIEEVSFEYHKKLIELNVSCFKCHKMSISDEFARNEKIEVSNSVIFHPECRIMKVAGKLLWNRFFLYAVCM